ncbi:hypothetical protein BGZ68_001282 [Mortierella alpina]|nr:hypothetical protein BGZ68_001282 [Mortierella alpina]
MARVVSPMAVPLSVDIPYHNSKNELNKRASDYEVATTAVKVDMPYHSYLNHPFTHPKELEHRQQKQQASGNKYSSYTNSSKSIRLITIPSKKMAGIMNEDLSLSSPTSPLVSPPPPYLHSSAPEQHGDSKAYGLDTKKQQPSVQWPSMMKLSDATGTTTAAVTRPKMAKVLPPQAIPIQYDELPTAASPGPRRASRLFDGNQSSMFNVHVPQDALAQEISAATSLVESFSTSRTTPKTFPSFWQETRQSKFLWVFLPFGCATLGSVAWVLTMQVFMELAIVMPVIALALLSLQFGRYRWRRGRFLKKQKNKSHHSAAVSDDKIVSAFPHYDEHGAYLAPHQPQQQGPSPSRQQRHHVTFQEPASPQPRFNQQSYKQPRISNAAQGNKQGPHRQQQQQQQPQQQPQPQPQQSRMPLTVNPGLYRANLNNHTGVNNGSPHYQNPQFLSPVDSPQTPPPAYFLKRVELPEIDPIVGEFEVDFSCIQY